MDHTDASPSDATLEDLEEELDAIKHRWSKGEYLYLPGPIEEARRLVRELKGDPLAEYGDDYTETWYREDCVYGSVTSHDLYPRNEIEVACDELVDEDRLTFVKDSGKAGRRYCSTDVPDSMVARLRR